MTMWAGPAAVQLGAHPPHGAWGGSQGSGQTAGLGCSSLDVWVGCSAWLHSTHQVAQRGLSTLGCGRSAGWQ